MSGKFMERNLLDSVAGPGTSAFEGQCAHLFASGRRCTRRAVESGEICVLHGGDTGSEEETTRRRLLALQQQSFHVIEELLSTGDDKTRSYLAISILDRSGVSPRSSLPAEGLRDASDLSSLTMEELANEFDRLADVARRRKPDETGTKKPKSKRMNEDSMNQGVAPPASSSTH